MLEMIEEKKWKKEFEEEITSKWKEEEHYKFNPIEDKSVYSLDFPPPYVNSPIHMGHAVTFCLMDMVARYKRMTNHNVLFTLGFDKNGLPIETATEKKFKISLLTTPRETFLEKAKQLLDESTAISEKSLERLGISFNSWKTGKEIGDKYETNSEQYRTLTQTIFLDLWEREQIYEAERICNYCTGCQTPIADAEIDYKDSETKFNHVNFNIKDSDEKIIIATTRPELLSTCKMIIYNPEDERYKHLEGKNAITPIYNKEVPIKAHKQASIDKGTGLVMMCSAGDLSDIQFFREMNLEAQIAINKDGKMNEIAGPLNGLKVKEGRQKIIELLEKEGVLVEQKTMSQRTPICERSKHEIEFIEMKSLYLKQSEYKNQIQKIANKITFFSENSREILDDWISKINTDWPITRDRYYATEVPLWKCKDCSEFYAPPKEKYYQPWKEKAPGNCKKCNSSNLEGDKRVLDTWFDSSNTSLYILKYPKPFYNDSEPCSLRPQGKEIIRSWLYYTILKVMLITKKPAFKDVLINHHVLDGKGKKMSKSDGNIIDPQKLLQEYGTEALRFWSVNEGNIIKKDLPCSTDKIESANKTLIKLWNVTRFISLFEKTDEEKELTDIDKWILNELNELVESTKNQYEVYDFHESTQKIKTFLWETLASHYIELAKSRAYNQEEKYTKKQQAGAIQTLNYVIETLLKLLAPITPIITYKLYQNLQEKNIHLEKFPEKTKNYQIPFTKEDIENLNSLIWKAKKDEGLALNAPIKEITIPEKLKSIEQELKITHKIENITYGEIKITIK